MGFDGISKLIRFWRSKPTGMIRKVLFIVGPTASGKTRLSIELASLVKGEVVSADSRQIYKYMDIGTAKPSMAELKEVPHHFIDLYEPSENYNAGKFSREARTVIQQIFKSRRFPMVVGGSGLYLKALIEGFSIDDETTDEKVRNALRNRIAAEGNEGVHAELRRVDPDSAKVINVNDTQRLLRALEVYITTGKPYSEVLKTTTTNRAPIFPIFVGLEWDRDMLYRNIDLRVDKMIDDGLIVEVAQLKQRGYDETLNSLQTVGYKEVFAYFNGELHFSEMIDKIKQHSRNYAKRQMTWFRNQADVKWFPVDYLTNYFQLAQDVYDYFNSIEIPDSYYKQFEQS